MFGIFSKTTDPAVVQAAGYGGLDFIILDQEHGNVSNQNLENLIRAAHLSNILPIVRVADFKPASVGSALDMGASGVQIPNISTADQARAAVKSAKFFPDGSRGVCRYVPAALYGSINKDEYFRKANECLVILQIEGEEGLLNIDEILTIKGIDIVFIGPYDLSQSLGLLGDIDNSKVQQAIRQITFKALSLGVKVGVFCDTLESCNLMKSIGIEYIAFSVDVHIFHVACKNIVSSLNK